MANTLSFLVLAAMIYGLYLQRVHNVKSVRPLGQIDFMDQTKLIYVHIQNNGLGPLIIDRLAFIRDGQQHSNIEKCLDLDKKSYMHIPITDSATKVILPGSYLEIFSTRFEDYDTDSERSRVRHQLTPLTLKVYGRDIYDNKISIERSFEWFSRHAQKESRQAIVNAHIQNGV